MGSIIKTSVLAKTIFRNFYIFVPVYFITRPHRETLCRLEQKHTGLKNMNPCIKRVVKKPLTSHRIVVSSWYIFDFNFQISAFHEYKLLKHQQVPCIENVSHLKASGQITTYPAINDLIKSVVHTLYTFRLDAQKCPDTPISQGLVNLSKSTFSGEECR